MDYPCKPNCDEYIKEGKTYCDYAYGGIGCEKRKENDMAKKKKKVDSNKEKVKVLGVDLSPTSQEELMLERGGFKPNEKPKTKQELEIERLLKMGRVCKKK